ncbi:hypothetical protein [Longimicrobium sp.]|nr:hypothetical protein [Longimicrobium sp.]HEX6038851.1 hypothetical protein [Longimicrobium sp.]
MNNLTLNLEALAVESFPTAESQSISGTGDCTGCDSGCGIIDYAAVAP